MVQNDPRAKENAIIKKKSEKYFSGGFRCILSIFGRCRAIFGGPKSYLPYCKDWDSAGWCKMTPEQRKMQLKKKK